MLQAGGFDLHLEKQGDGYKAHYYPYGRVFGAAELKTLSFGTLRELNAHLRTLSAP